MKKIKKILISIGLLAIILCYTLNNNFLIVTKSNKKFSVVNSNIKVSIIGDSISTYEGYSCEDVGSWYYGPSDSTTITESQRRFNNGYIETWWGRFIHYNGFSLGANASYGGSKVTDIENINPYTGLKIPSFLDDKRITKLGENGIPDFIFVFGGMNDLINIVGNDGGDVVLYDSNYDTTNTSTFLGAYYQLFVKLKQSYPNTKIVAIIPYDYGKNTRGGYKEIKQVMLDVLNAHNIEYVDLGNTILNQPENANYVNYIVDTDVGQIHPNTYGMDLIYQAIMNSGISFKVNDVDVPTCLNNKYTGQNQNLISLESGYNTTGNISEKNAGSYTLNFTPTVGYQWNDGTRKNTKTMICKILPADIQSVNSESLADEYYTGSEIKPNLTIKYNGATLEKDKDYTLSYSNNINVGEATIKVIGKGNYTGTKEIKFNILKSDITSSTVDYTSNITYTGNEIKAISKISLKGKTLLENTDYTLVYSDNINVGKATAKITGKGNYTGTKEINFNILSVDISKADISSISNKNYTGSEIKPNPTIKYNGATLEKDKDYTLSYGDNVNAGEATIKITGKGNYTGTTNKNFNILPIDLTTSNIEKIDDKIYTGNEIKPNPTIILNGKTLEKDKDYTLSYSNNINVGEATIKITGKGNYAGTINNNFNIVQTNISKLDIESISNKIYTGSEIKPNPTITLNGATLEKDKDYTISYSNNVNVGEATIKITGKENVAGTKEVKFSILQADISKTDISSISDKIYTGSEIKPSPIIKYNGKTLEKDKDYTISYNNNINVGEATLTIIGKGNFSKSITKNFQIIANNEDTSLKSLLVDGKSVLENLEITVPADIEKVNISAEAYNKNAIISGIGEKELVEGENKFEIIVTSESGKKQKYLLIITRETKKIDESLCNLAVLKVENFTLKPNFDPNILEYTIEVESNIENINIIAIPTKSESKVIGTGIKKLEQEKNKFEIIVSSSNGCEKKYILYVNKKEIIKNEETLPEKEENNNSKNDEINQDKENIDNLNQNETEEKQDEFVEDKTTEKNPQTGIKKIGIGIIFIEITVVLLMKKIKQNKRII